MEKRYLIKGEVYQGSEIPKEENYEWSHIFADEIDGWKIRLVKLDCDESELDKIKDSFKRWIFYNEIIDITSITTVKDGKVYFKEVESESNEAIELKYTTQEMIDAVNYGFKYANESQNHTGDVPIGNILQWIMYKRNLLNVPKEFEIFKHNQTK